VLELKKATQLAVMALTAAEPPPVAGELGAAGELEDAAGLFDGAELGLLLPQAAATMLSPHARIIRSDRWLLMTDPPTPRWTVSAQG
jgi:hypothetical protein